MNKKRIELIVFYSLFSTEGPVFVFHLSELFKYYNNFLYLYGLK